MKRFLIQFLLFLIPVVVVAYFVDAFISQNLRKSKIDIDEYSVWNDIYDGKVNSDIVIYGSSRAWVHIDPVMMGDSLHTTVYNLGIDGHNFWLQYLRHKALLEHNTKPKLIIYSLDIFTMKKREDLYNPEQFLPYMLFNNEMRDATLSYKGYSYLDYEVPLIRYYGQKESIIAAWNHFRKSKKDTTIRIRGYQAQDKSWNNDLVEAKKKMTSFTVDLDSATIKLFDRFLTECRQDGINMLLVYSPEYIEGQKFVGNRDQIIALYKMFSAKYNIPFLDYSYDPMSYNTDYFFNSMHLNKKGAELFTNELIDTLRTMNRLYKEPI